MNESEQGQENIKEGPDQSGGLPWKTAMCWVFYLFKKKLRYGFAVLLRLDLNSWIQAILLP
jgi:hypothetical protein